MHFPALLAACALAALVCATSCASREERADAAFAGLVTAIDALTAELARVDSETRAEEAAEGLEERCDELWECLEDVDKWGEDPELPQEARRSIGEKYHAELKRAVDSALAQAYRLAERRLYSSPRLEKLSRHAYARYRSTGKHPWPRAVFHGREYRPKPRQ